MEVRKDLIYKELYDSVYYDKYKPTYHLFKLTSKNIDKLFNNYYVHEYTEHFYDSEPNPDRCDFITESTEELYELIDMSYDYKYNLNDIEHRITTKNYTEEELRLANKKIEYYYNLYDKSEIKLTFNNWIEVYGNGIWGMSQYEVDRICIHILKYYHKRKHKLKDRVYISNDNDGYIHLYFYLRDIESCDLHFIFKRRKKHD